MQSQQPEQRQKTSQHEGAQGCLATPCVWARCGLTTSRRTGCVRHDDCSSCAAKGSRRPKNVVILLALDGEM